MGTVLQRLIWNNISWSVYLRKYFWHLPIWVMWYLSSYAHWSSEGISWCCKWLNHHLSYICSYKEISLIICSGKEISLMVQNVFVLIFSIFFAIRWSKISSQSSPFKCSALKRVIWGKLIIILFHIIIIIICIFIINNHHHTTKTTQKYVFKRMLEPQRTHSIGSTLATCNINQTWPKKILSRFLLRLSGIQHFQAMSMGTFGPAAFNFS